MFVSRPSVRRVALALCLVPLLSGLAGPRAASAKTRLGAHTAATIENGSAGKVAGKNPCAPRPDPQPELEPNDDFNSSMYVDSPARVRGDIAAFDVDYYGFYAGEGDRVYAATMTAFADGSQDTVLDLVDADGSTVLESDDNSGTFAETASSLAGSEIPTDGMYYLRVSAKNDGDQIRTYDLYFQLRDGSPTAEAEPNDDDENAQPISPSAWISGASGSMYDEDHYSIELEEGDTIFASMDLDPERTSTPGFGILALKAPGFHGISTSASDSPAGVPSRAFCATVRSAGTYSLFFQKNGTAPLSAYTLSVTVFPRSKADCQTYASTDVPKTIPSGDPTVVTSTLTVPGNPRVAHIRVDLDLSYYPAPNLDVQLTSPDGGTVSLFSDLPSGQSQMSFTLDDSAALPVDAAKYYGVYPSRVNLVLSPEHTSRLGWFDGVDAGGTWTLTVRTDTTSNSTGTLENWGLQICPDTTTYGAGGTPTSVYSQDFEDTGGDYTSAGYVTDWAWGAPDFEPITTAHSGTKCWKTALDAPYANGNDENLYSAPIELPDNGVLRLSWAQKVQLDSSRNDHAWVSIEEYVETRCKTADCPGVSRTLWEYDGPAMRDSVGNPETTIEETGGWAVFERNVSDFGGKTVRIVWHLDSDANGFYAGVAVDDVKVDKFEFAPPGGSDLNLNVLASSAQIAAGDDVTYSISAANNGDDAGTTTVTLPLPAGTTFVDATAPAGWSATTPLVGANGTVTFSTANFESGASAVFSVVAAVGCALANGTVSATATVAGTVYESIPCDNSKTATFTVTSTEPTISSCPDNLTVEAASDCGATATYTAPTATGGCGNATVVCEPASGSTFALGTTTVTCTAGGTVESREQTASCSFTVTVQDTTAPEITCPNNIMQQADAGACSTAVSFGTSVSDACEATVVCVPASGSTFPVGVTTVTCTATDTSNNSSSCSFTVTVADVEAPTITSCPDNMIVVASTPTGQPVTFTPPTANDACSGATVACAPASGSTFALGTTTVTCTATDAANHTASCSFTVTVLQHDTVGIYIPSTNARFLRSTNTGGNADLVYTYGGGSSLVPIKGDWDNDGVDTPGLYNPATGTFFLKNSNAPGNADLTFNFGAGGIGYIPIAGDWDNMNGDSVGLYNPATGAFFLKNSNSSGDADIVFVFGAGGIGYLPVAGDWDGTDGDSVGLYNPATSVFFLKNDLAAGDADFVFQFGQTAGGYLPIAGDWNNDGADTIGIYKPSTAGFFLTDTIPNITADYIFVYGPTDATPIVGNWDGF